MSQEEEIGNGSHSHFANLSLLTASQGETLPQVGAALMASQGNGCFAWATSSSMEDTPASQSQEVLQTPHPPTPDETPTQNPEDDMLSLGDENQDDAPEERIVLPAGTDLATCIAQVNSWCEDEYSKQKNSKSLLFAMACGVKDESGRRIAELEEEPYKSLIQKVPIKFKVNNPDYIKEVGCHCEERGLQINKCSNWKKQHIKQALYDMLPLNPLDIKWLIGKEAHFLHALEAAAAEKRPTSASAAMDDDDKAPAWHTHLPYLCLYCCLTLDEVKVHMSSQFCVMDREELLARNSELCPSTYWQLLSDMTPVPNAPLFDDYLIDHWNCRPL
jgi:hypothetical protein